MASNNIEKIRHSLAHLLAASVLKKFPGTKLGIGPVIENGFYYDFDFGKKSFSEKDLDAIEKEMKELIKKGVVFKKEIIDYKEAKKLFAKEPYKSELVEELNASKEKLSVYKSGEFFDLCAGPHVNSSEEINRDAFKLTRIAGAYWRGSEKNPMLTRIYGVAFETSKELDDYLKLQEEIEKRDHRILGEKLDFFMIDEKIGKGLPILLPKGHLVRKLLEDYIYKLEQADGYSHVLTPILAKEELYKTSGHLAHYKDDMYAPIEIENEKYYLKPMNCPHHHSIYSHKLRSYRDLPLRIAEFGHVHRFERSGVLTGLIRVRGFTQNDAHIYTTPQNLEEEIFNVLELAKKVYGDFKISDYWYRLSLPDFKNKEKFGDVKNKKMWDHGSEALRKVLKKMGVKFIEALGEASFYGPKIDIQIKNVHGKEDTIATIQVDYYSAGKFNLSYVDSKGKEQPPVIIHRAIFGSFERFFAFLLEKTAGKLPLWLSPEQAVVIGVGESHKKYAEEILGQLKNIGIRAALLSEDTVGKRIREAELQKIPYILVVGDKEVQNKSVNVRHYERGQEGEIKVLEFLEKLKEEIVKKS